MNLVLFILFLFDSIFSSILFSEFYFYFLYFEFK